MSTTKRDTDLIGRGWSFPIQWNVSDEVEVVSGNESIRQSIRLIVATSLGERVMRPEFGAGLTDFLFEPNEPALWNVVRDAVETALMRYEPRIEVEEVTVEMPNSGADDSITVDDAPTLLVNVDYRVGTTNARFNVVNPFYLQEGEAKP